MIHHWIKAIIPQIYINMKILYLFSFLIIPFTYCQARVSKLVVNNQQLKPRVVILTDIAPGDIEPDDMESMVRLLAHADQYEIEALIATGGWNSSGRAYPAEWMNSIFTAIDAYSKDLPNLMKRSNQKGFNSLGQENGKQKLGYWPSAAYLKSRVALGSSRLGMKEIGANNNTQGSDMIIRLVDESDERPLYISTWGGANTLAQAIWKVKQTRTTEQLNKFLSKLCVYTITDQDVGWDQRYTNYPFSSHQWMRREFEGKLKFIWDETAWLSQCGNGSKHWDSYAKYIQGHGYLGRVYPNFKYGVEGDTPSYLYITPNGLSNPQDPRQAGWGGYFEWGIGMDKETNCWTNHTGKAKEIAEKYANYFYQAEFNDFAARMDWAEFGKGNRNPTVIVNGVSGIQSLAVKAKAGEKIKLDATKSIDPDGDKLSVKWWQMAESGTYHKELNIEDENSECIYLNIPKDASKHEIHIICEVTDNGKPNLTSYRRIIISVK